MRRGNIENRESQIKTTRVFCTSTRMATKTNKKQYQGCGEVGTLIYLQWEYEMVELL